MILFKPELAALIITGKKWQTRRWWKNDKNGNPVSRAKVGSEHWAQLNMKPESRFARILIIAVWEWVPFMITKAEAKAEGFETPKAFFEAYQRINAHRPYDPNRSHWALEFSVVSLHMHRSHPQIVKDAHATQSEMCDCGDWFFPVNPDTSQSQCATCLFT